jgi:hypothetical protein
MYLAAVLVLILSCVVVAREDVILDTDIGGDCDDAAAVATLHALADRGEIRILAIGVVNTHPDAVPCLDAINTWYGRQDVPVGTIKRDTGFVAAESSSRIVKSYPHRLTRETATDVLKLYRRTLADAEDRSVTLVAIGPPTNISDLLRTEGDDISPLSGRELVRAKVKVYVAGGNGGGNLPKGRAGWNYQQDLPAARHELETFPKDVPMVFVGGSGWRMPTGNCFWQVAKDHIVRVAYEEFFQGKRDMQRPSPDQLRVLYAGRPEIRGRWKMSERGQISVDDKGQIHWIARPEANQSYGYVEDLPAMTRLVEQLMCHDPRVKAAQKP